MRRIAGASQSRSLQNILHHIVGLISLPKWAPGLARVDKGSTYATIQRYCDYLSSKRPSVVKDILVIAELIGRPCRDQVGLVHANLLGQDESSFEFTIFAIILFILGTHDDATKKEIIIAAIQDFVISNVDQCARLLQGSESGQLLNLPAPFGHAVDITSLPGYLALDPEGNPDGCEQAWEDLFIIIINILSFEEITKTNIGALEKALMMFQITLETYFDHPFRQQLDEPVAHWSARVYGEFRVTCGACIDAGCADRCPTEAMLISLAYVCILKDIWERAVYIMKTDNLTPTNFQEVTNLLLHAEHQLSYQDPKVTIAKQLRAAIEAKEKSASQKKAVDSTSHVTSEVLPRHYLPLLQLLQLM